MLRLPPIDPALPEEDARHLRRAVELGREGWAGAHPNPMVGCVLVRDGEVVGEGFHEFFGEPHAEVRALRAAGPAAEGATAYVSLEPCRHEGKTPACTRALIGSKVARVVYGAADPGRESGGGAEELRAAGIDVSGPHLSAEDAARENPAFFHRFQSEAAWVALKLAISLDGAINQAPDGSGRVVRTRLTGTETAREVHRLRSGFDAVMVGATTARVDDPELTVRAAPAPPRPPVRIVLDAAATLGDESRLAATAREVPVWLFCGEDVDESEVERLEAHGVRVHPVPRVRSGGLLDLDTVLRECRLLGVESILCEGGATLGRSLIAGGYARRLHLFQAPLVLGGEALQALDVETGRGWRPIAPPVAHGDDVHLILERTT